MVKRHESVRIIAGEWRGRLLPVLEKEGLRPSKDMVRETLFNWLQHRLHNKRCLDCFAGTGALGFEAASRGAAEVVLVEQDRQVAEHLKKIVVDYASDKNIAVVNQSALNYLQQADSFDVIFLDPPFSLNLYQASIAAIIENNVLAEDGVIYIESSRRQGLPVLSSALVYSKEKSSGQVSYGLAEHAV